MSNPTLNGLDLTRLHAIVEAVRSDPELGHFEFRNTNRWIQGGENRSTIREFYGAKQWDASRTEAFVLTNGEPPVLLGENEAANPVEYLLHALAGCVTTTTVLHAAARGIRIDSISTRLRGTLDARGLLGLDPGVAPGYESIEVEMDIDADCPDEELEDLVAFARAHSPVRDTLSRPIPVTVRRADPAAD